MAPWRAMLGLFFVAMAVASPASAVTIGGAVDHFHLEMAPPGATICVALPASDTRPGDCVGVGIEELRRGVAGSTVTQVLVVRRGGDDYLVHYSVELGREPRTVLGMYSNELAKLIGQNLSVRESLTHVHLGEVEVFGRSFLVTREAALGESNVIQYFLVPGRSAVHAVSIVSPESMSGRARSELFASLEHATVEVSFMARLGRHANLGLLVEFAGLVVLTAGVALAVARQRRKRVEAALKAESSAP